GGSLGRVRSSLLLLACLAAVAGAILIASSDAEDEAADGPCGPPIARSDGQPWSCTFADEFDGDQLDRGKWSVMLTETTGFSHAGECYIDDPRTISVQDGILELSAHELEEPHMCGTRPTPHVSGMIHTKETFAQTYGRFEARIRFPSGSGLHGAWWMWPRDQVYGEQSGEIDVAEHWGKHPDIVSPYVHIKDAAGAERGRGGYCNVTEPGDSFHTYAVEWLPSSGFVFSYDGAPCMTFSDWDPGAPLTFPQPFDQPFFLVMTLALESGAVDENTPFPATMQVDYVRAWS
ncbi:MAG TPA: glycoside hydrolase family 16 protein, partial [Solirubrobacterales bacterium]|nr:glycoside hydrolase family 16 protein [Solirubrobacterales bacterium]